MLVNKIIYWKLTHFSLIKRRKEKTSFFLSHIENRNRIYPVWKQNPLYLFLEPHFHYAWNEWRNPLTFIITRDITEGHFIWNTNNQETIGTNADRKRWARSKEMNHKMTVSKYTASTLYYIYAAFILMHDRDSDTLDFVAEKWFFSRIIENG